MEELTPQESSSPEEMAMEQSVPVAPSAPSKKKFILIAAIVVIVAVLGVGWSVFARRAQPANKAFTAAMKASSQRDDGLYRFGITIPVTVPESVAGELTALGGGSNFVLSLAVNDAAVHVRTRTAGGCPDEVDARGTLTVSAAAQGQEAGFSADLAFVILE